MACERHGTTNPTFCKYCDAETIEKYTPKVPTTWCPVEYADCTFADCIANGCKSDPLTRRHPEQSK